MNATSAGQRELPGWGGSGLEAVIEAQSSILRNLIHDSFKDTHVAKHADFDSGDAVKQQTLHQMQQLFHPTEPIEEEISLETAIQLPAASSTVPRPQSVTPPRHRPVSTASVSTIHPVTPQSSRTQAFSTNSTPIRSNTPSPGTMALPEVQSFTHRTTGNRQRRRGDAPRTILSEWIVKSPTRKGLWGLGRLRKSHRRWCVLRTDIRQGAALIYYDSNNPRIQKRKGLVQISLTARVSRDDENTFTLTSNRRTFRGTCDTPEIASKWVTEITNCIMMQPREPAIVTTCC